MPGSGGRHRLSAHLEKMRRGVRARNPASTGGFLCHRSKSTVSGTISTRIRTCRCSGPFATSRNDTARNSAAASAPAARAPSIWTARQCAPASPRSRDAAAETRSSPSKVSAPNPKHPRAARLASRSTCRNAAIASRARSCRPRHCWSRRRNPPTSRSMTPWSGNICRCGTYQRIKRCHQDRRRGGQPVNDVANLSRRLVLGGAARLRRCCSVCTSPATNPDRSRLGGITASRRVCAKRLCRHRSRSGLVTIVVPRSEMGTASRRAGPGSGGRAGSRLELVRVIQAQGDAKYGDQNTDGSRSTRQFLGRCAARAPARGRCW